MAYLAQSLVQNSTIFASLISTFVTSWLALGKLQYVLQYIVMNTFIAKKTNFGVLIVFFSSLSHLRKPLLVTQCT